jgi:hypothetical protein
VNLTRRSLFGLIAALPIWARLGFSKQVQESNPVLDLDLEAVLDHALDILHQDAVTEDEFLSVPARSQDEVMAFYAKREAVWQQRMSDAESIGIERIGRGASPLSDEDLRKQAKYPFGTIRHFV